jgi:hypothetical protein
MDKRKYRSQDQQYREQTENRINLSGKSSFRLE